MNHPSSSSFSINGSETSSYLCRRIKLGPEPRPAHVPSCAIYVGSSFEKDKQAKCQMQGHPWPSPSPNSQYASAMQCENEIEDDTTDRGRGESNDLDGVSHRLPKLLKTSWYRQREVFIQCGSTPKLFDQSINRHSRSCRSIIRLF
jgi:hypothetical protein